MGEVMTTPPLPELFERVAAKVPEIRRIDRANLQWICGGWWHGDEVGVPEPIAEALIESACVTYLTARYHSVTIQVGVCAHVSCKVFNADEWHEVNEDHPTLLHALLYAVLLAVEAVGGGGKEARNE